MNHAWDDGIEISAIGSLADLAEWQAVEALVWSGAGSEILHTGLLITLQRYGGLLLSARDRSGKMVGVLLGFPGLKDGKVVHCSHLLGMLPEWRSKHVGYRMKLRQREYVLDQGLDLVVWTFDPLESRNAHLNIGHLGAVANHYSPNLYGIMNDDFNHDMESDRLTASWHIRHPRVEACLAGARPTPSARDLLALGLPHLTRCEIVEADAPYVRLIDTTLGRDEANMLVEVPSNFQAIKSLADADARAWRYGIRSVFTDLFGRGYAVLDFAADVRPGALTRCYYVVGRLDSFQGEQA